MKVATFNVNGIRARLPQVTKWIDECSPDIILLQETKCIDEAFPKEPFEDRGYAVETHGEKQRKRRGNHFPTPA